MKQALASSLIGSIALAGCIGAGEGEPAAEAGALVLAPPRVSPYYYWKQGDPPLQLSETRRLGLVGTGVAFNLTDRDHFCALNYMSGRFRGPVESVGLSRNDAGEWILDGQSAQADVAVGARC